MGKYPPAYPLVAVAAAEDVVQTVVPDRLVKVGDRWNAKPFLLSSFELDLVRTKFAGRVNDPTLLSLIGLVFSKTLPLLHHQFVSEGFQLSFGQSDNGQTIVVTEQSPCTNGYVDWGPGSSRQAALDAVRALVEWQLALHRESFDPDKLPNGPEGFGLALINAEVYRWIKGLGKFMFCRTRNMIEFIEEAVPDLHEEWTHAGFTLTPDYYIDRHERRTALRLIANA